MPDSSEAHRTSTGVFYSTLIHILERKSSTRNGKAYNKKQRTRTSGKNCELFSWLACVSLSLLYFLSLLLLTNCMDVELNPGPDTHSCATFMEKAQENIEMRFQQILQCLHAQSATLGEKIDDIFYTFGQTLKNIESEVMRLKQEVEVDRGDIKDLLSDRDNAHTRIERMERDIERLEVHSRQANLKFLGINEPDPRENRSDVDEIVDTLNYFSSSHTTWRNTDIEKVHRLGRAREHNQQRGYHQHDRPRPLIVTFCHVDHKVSILRDRELRERLRRNNIRVTTDLTPRQREQLQRYKQEGKVAYYRNGRLYVDNGRSQIEFREDSSNHRHFDRRTNHKAVYSSTGDNPHSYNADQDDYRNDRRGADSEHQRQEGRQGDRRRHHNEEKETQDPQKLKDHARQRAAGPTSSRHLHGNHIDKENWTHNSHVEPLALNRRSHQEAYWYNNVNDYNSRGGEWQLPQAVAGYYPPWNEGTDWFNPAGYYNTTSSGAPTLLTTHIDDPATTPQENHSSAVNPPFVDSAAKRNDASTTDASTIVPPHLTQTHDTEAVSSTVPPETHVLETSPEVSVFETANADAASRADQRTPTSALQQPLQPEDTVAVTAEHQSQTAETTEAAEQQPQPTVEAEATLDQRPTADDPATAEGNQDQLQEETQASAGRHQQPVPAARATDQQPAAETVTTEEQPSTRGNPETTPEGDPTYAEVLRSPPHPNAQSADRALVNNNNAASPHSSGSQSTPHTAGDSPLPARGARPETTDPQGSSRGGPETRKPRSKSQAGTRTTRQTSLHSVWQLEKDMTRK